MRAHVLACLVCLRAGILTVLVLSMLACFMSLRAHMSYMFAVLKYLTYLNACVLGILVFLIYFTFEKLNSKNSYIEEFGYYSEVHLEPT